MREGIQETPSVTGIIAEYNPFHSGHAWQLEEIRRRRPGTIIVAMMSGSFCQRGDAAILDKFTRANLAIAGGCDLVLELPFVFACRSAQAFAAGGVQLFARLGLGGCLAFGAETDHLSALRQIASYMDESDFQQTLHERIRQGESYAAALAGLLETQRGSNVDLRAPNNILAIEYLRVLQRFPSLTPMLVPRRGAGHNDASLPKREEHSASGTAIRRELLAARSERRMPDWAVLSGTMPVETAEALRETFPDYLPDRERLFPALQLRFLTMTDADIDAIYGVNAAEGMTGRLRRAMREAGSLQEFIDRAATRRYPAARIRRLVPFLLLGISDAQMAAMDAAGPLYARVLACGPRGREILHTMKKTAKIPIIAKMSQYLTTKTRESDRERNIFQQQLILDTWATDLRGLMFSQPLEAKDFHTSPRFSGRS